VNNPGDTAVGANAREGAVDMRPVVLVVVGHYRPGFLAGGIITCVASIVSRLKSDFRFKVITRDRDLGGTTSYSGIKVGEWTSIDGSEIYYVRSGRGATVEALRVAASTPHDILFLNSFFEPLVIAVLLARKSGSLPRKPALLSPHGEFARPSLRQKFLKKIAFIRGARVIGMYTNLTWHASNAIEAADISHWMGIASDHVRVAHQFPAESNSVETLVTPAQAEAGADVLRVCFVSRIMPEKNLHVALDVLKNVRARVDFDIIGPIESRTYWADCEGLIDALPRNIAVRYAGPIAQPEIVPTLRQYDLLLLPSSSEAYGHVIAESLLAGTRVLVSTETPWRDLESKGIGWDVPLANLARYFQIIDEFADRHELRGLGARKQVQASFERYLVESNPVVVMRELLRGLVATEQSDNKRESYEEI
jgi:glycosyltransferase involved in cell wall biosynthesis